MKYPTMMKMRSRQPLQSQDLEHDADLAVLSYITCDRADELDDY